MMKMKKSIALVLIAGLVFSMTGCKKEAQEAAETSAEETTESDVEDITAEADDSDQGEVLSDIEADITWWTYPVFVQDEGSVDGTYEKELIKEFNKKYPNISVNLEILDYTDGPDKVAAAIEEGTTPDVLLDGPSRISTYAKQGALEELGKLFTEDMVADMSSGDMLSACEVGDGYYMYPLSATNYVMAFNRSMLETTGAIELMNREGAHEWNVEAFEAVIEKLDNSGFNGGSVFCSGIAGDYATRSFVTNLYDGALMDEAYSGYTINSENGLKALDKITEWIGNGWMLNGSGESGAEAVESFVAGDTSFTLLWSLPQAIRNTAALESSGVEVIVMPYPSEDGLPSLEYILNGFCVFHHDDEARTEASQYLIDYICNDETAAKENVLRTGAFPVRASMQDVYDGNEEALFYEALVPYSGKYYNKVEGFEAMRVYWYQMLAEILNGEYDTKVAADSFVEYANETMIVEETE